MMVRRKTAEASLVGKTSLRVRFSEVDSMQIVWLLSLFPVAM